MTKIHSRCIARPLNRFTHVESFQPGFQVLSNGHESIQRTRFNGFKFNRRHPLSYEATTGTACAFHEAVSFFRLIQLSVLLSLSEKKERIWLKNPFVKTVFKSLSHLQSYAQPCSLASKCTSTKFCAENLGNAVSVLFWVRLGGSLQTTWAHF